MQELESASTLENSDSKWVYIFVPVSCRQWSKLPSLSNSRSQRFRCFTACRAAGWGCLAQSRRPYPSDQSRVVQVSPSWRWGKNSEKRRCPSFQSPEIYYDTLEENFGGHFQRQYTMFCFDMFCFFFKRKWHSAMSACIVEMQPLSWHGICDVSKLDPFMLHGICSMLDMIFAAFLNLNLPFCMKTFHFGCYLEHSETLTC